MQNGIHDLPDDTIPAHFAAILQSIDAAVIGGTPEGLVSIWNSGAEHLLGYTGAEIIGKPFSILDLQDVNGIQLTQTQLRRKDGNRVEVHLTHIPVRVNRIVGVLIIATEMAERRLLEKAERDRLFLSAIVSSADDAIISKDLNGVITSWNSAAEDMFGYTSEEMIGRPVAILIPQDHPDEEPRILDRIRRGERIAHYETQRVRKDGRLIHVSLTVSPIRDRNDVVIGASKIARDITGQKQAAIREREALLQAQQARRQAEEASRTKDEFLATVSHELRTPMTAIMGWSRILMSGQQPAELQHKALETIERNARSQAQLIEDLLDISRIITGKLRVELKPVDLAAVIGAAAEAVRPAAEAKNIRIQTRINPDVGQIVGDFERLQQVIWNLLSNAIRFTEAKGLVQIALRRADSQVELQVSDNGVGIKPEFLPRIFDRFTQADSSITRTQGGLGMGLAIVKSLVELHGGVVSAASPGQGQGSVFTVRLPMSAVRHDLDRSLPGPRPLLEAVLRPELLGIKILVVDDEADTCDMLSFIFSQVGAIVETADSAETALKVFDRWLPDILVSDIGMPHVDGYELIRQIRKERRSGIPAVALTALARIDDRVKALKVGFQMHVSKPVQPAELISIVAGLVGFVNRDVGA